MRTFLLAATLCALFQADAIAAQDPAVRCDIAKLRAAGQKARAFLTCYAQGAGTADPSCLARASERFEDRWRRIEAQGGCAVTGDVAAAEAKIDAFVADFVASTTTVPTTSSSLSSATTTTTITVTSSTIVCVTTTGAFTLCGRMCGAAGRCPQGQTCSEASEGCNCVGDPIPCGDPRLGVHCGYGECPPGFTCDAPAECAGAGLPCSCRPVP